MVQMKQKMIIPEVIINLLGIPELKEMRTDGNRLRIGSTVKLAALERSSFLQDGREILAQAAYKVGSPQIRNLGTIGGNLCNGSPAADTAPSLLAMEGEVSLIGREGERSVLLEVFFTGPGETILKKGEILKEVVVPQPPPNSSGCYLKLGRRKSMDLSLVSIAVLLTLNPKTGNCERARVALGSVFPTPFRARKTERILEGNKLEEYVIKKAGECAEGECRPISDIRSSAEYRREMVKILVQRAIHQTLAEKTWRENIP